MVLCINGHGHSNNSQSETFPIHFTTFYFPHLSRLWGEVLVDLEYTKNSFSANFVVTTWNVCCLSLSSFVSSLPSTILIGSRWNFNNVFRNDDVISWLKILHDRISSSGTLCTTVSKKWAISYVSSDWQRFDPIQLRKYRLKIGVIFSVLNDVTLHRHSLSTIMFVAIRWVGVNVLNAAESVATEKNIYFFIVYKNLVLTIVFSLVCEMFVSLGCACKLFTE